MHGSRSLPENSHSTRARSCLPPLRRHGRYSGQENGQRRRICAAHSNTIILHPLSGRSPRFNTRLFALRCHKIPFCLSFTSFHLIFSLRPAAIRRQDDAFPHHELSAIRDRPPRTISDTRTISKFLRPVNRHSPQIQTLIFYLVSHEKFV